MTHYRCLDSVIIEWGGCTALNIGHSGEDFKNEWSWAFGCRSPLKFVGERPGFHQKNFRLGFHRQSVKDPRHFSLES